MVDGVRNVFRLMVMHIADKNTNAVGDIQRFTQTNAISYLFSLSGAMDTCLLAHRLHHATRSWLSYANDAC